MYILVKFDENQERDEHGRWVSSGSSGDRPEGFGAFKALPKELAAKTPSKLAENIGKAVEQGKKFGDSEKKIDTKTAALLLMHRFDMTHSEAVKVLRENTPKSPTGRYLLSGLNSKRANQLGEENPKSHIRPSEFQSKHKDKFEEAKTAFSPKHEGKFNNSEWDNHPVVKHWPQLPHGSLDDIIKAREAFHGNWNKYVSQRGSVIAHDKSSPRAAELIQEWNRGFGAAKKDPDMLAAKEIAIKKFGTDKLDLDHKVPQAWWYVKDTNPNLDVKDQPIFKVVNDKSNFVWLPSEGNRSKGSHLVNNKVPFDRKNHSHLNVTDVPSSAIPHMTHEALSALFNYQQAYNYKFVTENGKKVSITKSQVQAAKDRSRVKYMLSQNRAGREITHLHRDEQRRLREAEREARRLAGGKKR